MSRKRTYKESIIKGNLDYLDDSLRSIAEKIQGLTKVGTTIIKNNFLIDNVAQVEEDDCDVFAEKKEEKSKYDKRKQNYISLTIPHMMKEGLEREEAMKLLFNDWKMMTEEEKDDFLKIPFEDSSD